MFLLLTLVLSPVETLVLSPVETLFLSPVETLFLSPVAGLFPVEAVGLSAVVALLPVEGAVLLDVVALVDDWLPPLMDLLDVLGLADVVGRLCDVVGLLVPPPEGRLIPLPPPPLPPDMRCASIVKGSSIMAPARKIPVRICEEMILVFITKILMGYLFVLANIDIFRAFGGCKKS
jgi:hypothetical protein